MLAPLGPPKPNLTSLFLAKSFPVILMFSPALTRVFFRISFGYTIVILSEEQD